MIRDSIMDLYTERRAEAQAAAVERIERYHRDHPLLAQWSRQLAQLQGQWILAQAGSDEPQREAYLRQRGQLEAQRRAYLEAHQIPLDYDQPQYSCPICQDTGLRTPSEGQGPRPAGRYTPAQRCDCYYALLAQQFQIREQEQAIEGCLFEHYLPELIPASHERARAARDEIAARLQRLPKVWNQPQVKHLLITGGPDAGKTFLAGALVHRLRQQHIPVLYLSAQYLGEQTLLRMKQQYSYHPDQAKLEALEDEWQALLRVPVVVVDGLGTESIDPKVIRESLQALIEQRRRPTHLTVLFSQLTDRQQLSAYYRLGGLLEKRCSWFALPPGSLYEAYEAWRKQAHPPTGHVRRSPES